MQKLLLNIILISLLLTLNSCVELKDIRPCFVEGKITAGAYCKHTNYDERENLNFEQTVQLIESGSIILTIADYGELITELQQLCRDAGSGCTIAQEKNIRERLRHIRTLQKAED